MTGPEDKLRRLQALARLLNARDLARTARQAAELRATEARLATLAKAPPLVTDPSLFRARQAHLLWAQGQAVRLRQTQALQKARLIEQRAQAARSLGRSNVLDTMLAQAHKARGPVRE